jgi:hypothetical protein
MDSITILFDDISKIEWTIPQSIKTSLIIFIMLFISVGYYFFKDGELLSSWGQSALWLYIIIMINLINILAVNIYNSHLAIKQGKRGILGKSGKKGKEGKYLTCSYCQTNLYIDTVQKYDTLVSIDIHNTPSSQSYLNTINYLDKLLNTNNNYDYASIVNSIINISSTTASQNNNLSQILSLFNKDALQLLAINYLSRVVGKSSTDKNSNSLGIINRPYGKVGFLPLGDSIIGSIESDVELNYFMIKGDIVYPSIYKKLVHFPIRVNDEGLTETIAIWQPEPVIISNSGKSNTYYSIGDLVNFTSDTPPTLNSIALISENCLQEIEDSQMDLMFLYSGISSITNTSKTFKQNTETTDESDTDIESDNLFNITTNTVSLNTIFSVWRTPFNTMITNIPSPIQNNTVAYNIINGRTSMLDQYGNVKLNSMKFITNKLSSIEPSILMKTIFIIYHFSLIYRNELDYYINKTLSSNPTLRAEYRTNMNLGDLMNVVAKAKSVVDNYTGSSISSISRTTPTLQNTRGSRGSRGSRPPPEVPTQVLKIYSKIKNEANYIPFKIQNITNMLDMLEELFPNGLDTMISIDEEGDIQGGIRLTFSQEVFINVCKLLFLPDRQIMEIKDECIGTYQRDKTKDKAIKNFEDILTNYNRLMEKYKTEPEKICQNWNAVQAFSTKIFSRIGEYVGHIPNYLDKIEKQNFNDFTTSKINKIAELYEILNNYIEGKCFFSKSQAIKNLESALITYNELMAKYSVEPEKNCKNWNAVQSFSTQTFNKIGEYVGNIPNYLEKIRKQNFDEFTTANINKIAELYEILNNYIEEECV